MGVMLRKKEVTRKFKPLPLVLGRYQKLIVAMFVENKLLITFCTEPSEPPWPEATMCRLLLPSWAMPVTTVEAKWLPFVRQGSMPSSKLPLVSRFGPAPGTRPWTMVTSSM